MNKLIFIQLDGLNAKTAHKHMGFLEHLVEKGKIAAYTSKSELPAQSRPLYEVLQTGVASYENGIISNLTIKRSKEKSVFQIAKEHGYRTGAACYYWISELYNKSPFDMIEDRIQLNEENIIENGMFYFEDHYPDSHLIADAEYLIRKKETDYTLIHSMNIDDIGHKFGGNSKEYVQTTVRLDVVLSSFLLKWMEQGYQIVITSDHGMNEYFTHNGVSDEERLVPLYIYSDKIETKDYRPDIVVPQIEIAHLLCSLMGLPKSEKMASLNSIHIERR